MNPAFWAVANYRFGVWSARRGFTPWRKLTSLLYGWCFFWIDLITGIAINREAEIGPAFHLIHHGNVKIHPEARIGARCGMMHDVTLGLSPGREGAPVIGNDVFIGAGAKIVGPVEIGDGAMIGANSLVINHVPAGATALGVPARAMPGSRGAPKRQVSSTKTQQ
ncbi:hypothetical protein J3U88_21240 [Acanthopleuribacter pedis]|uniref:Serine acetyltransferase n=2 Tax=Acanthopleuribacter pedis TaxID=442870 RepID=A0A8J7U4U6_9BACT|nr:hypothetical protein [Acanthopleuribacter pedis]